MSRNRDYDAVVIGAGYGGLVCAAILARHRKRVLVVDRTDGVGGKGTCVPANPGSKVLVPYGQTGARDTADLFLLMSRKHRFGFEAARRAGVTLPLVGPIHPVMRGHVVPPGDECFLGADFNQYAQVLLGVPSGEVDSFRDTWKRLFSVDAESLEDVSLGDWLASLDLSDFHDAFERLANIFYSLPSSLTSARRFVKSMQTPIEIYYANHPKHGGLAGIAETYARAISDRGGEFRFQRELSEIATTEGRVLSVTLSTPGGSEEVVSTGSVVFSHVASFLFDALDPRLCPPEFVADLARLNEFDADIAVVSGVLSRLPRRRRDGAEEDYPGWNRVLRGSKRDYGGGWWFPSISSERVVPAGKHLVEIGHASGIESYARYSDESSARKTIDRILDHMRTYYVDLDDVLEETHFRINPPPNLDNWKFSSVRRPGITVPGVEGLYLVGASVDVEGAVQDIDANSAIQVADRILGNGTPEPA